MPYTPLTLQQYQSAQQAGFSPTQIIANEKIRQTQENNPFNPRNANNQFVNPNKPVAGTSTASKFLGSLKDTAGNMFIKPEQKLIADTGTRIAQAGVQTRNEFQNTGYSTPVDTGNPQRQNAGGTATPLPINAPAPQMNTSNSEMNINKPQQQLGVTVQPQQQGAEGAKQIGGQALNAVDAIGNVATAGELLPKAIDKATPLVKTGLNKATNIVDKTVGKQALARDLAKIDTKASEATWKTIQPELSKTELADAVKKGDVVKQGKLGTIKQIAKGRNAEMVEAAKPYVSNTKDSIEAVTNMQNGIQTEANNLRSGLQQSKATWSQKNLKGAINSIEKPHLLSGDLEKSFEKTMSVVLETAKNADKNLSGLLDVRQSLDKVVREQYPNLYNSDTMTPIKQAVTKTRAAINDLIEKGLPEGKTIDGISFKDSLKKQSLLYDAIDNTAPKTGKVGSNAVSRFAKTHPTLTKVGAGAIGFGTAEEIGRKLLGR